MSALFVGFFNSCEDEVAFVELEELTSSEINQLQYLIEEEKLARDVYLHLFETHNLFIFNNISGSEQKHMSFVAEVLDKYNITNPVKDQVGVFANNELQTLYDSFIIQGENSLQNAIIVGATIEDFDISDLTDFAQNTSKPDLKSLYNKLACGSRNHMRAFIGQLDIIGEQYEPQYISKNVFTEILAGSHESCDAY